MRQMWRRIVWSASLPRLIDGLMADKPFPILFITGASIGEAVLASGLMRRLLDEIPGARFTVATSRAALPLFAHVPNLEATIVAPEPGAWFSVWRAAQGRRWGLIVDLSGEQLSRFLSARRRAVRRHGAGDAGVHQVVAAARALRIEDDAPAPFLFTSEEIEAAAARHVGRGGPILAVAPAAEWVGKTWPAERFASAAARLLAPSGPLADGRLMIVGEASDREAGQALRLAVSRDRIIGFPGQLDLLTTYACLKRVRLFIGNDTGMMHLAAAAGAPTLGLFGPTDEARGGPWGPNARALRGARDLDSIRRADPQLSQALCHMLDLRVESVLAAAVRLLSETEPTDA
jgi:ADP-heptose:LPS heptosyltransferase